MQVWDITCLQISFSVVFEHRSFPDSRRLSSDGPPKRSSHGAKRQTVRKSEDVNFFRACAKVISPNVYLFVLFLALLCCIISCL